MLSSLSNRIFLASALLAVLSLGAALYLVNVVVTRQAEAELEESLLEAGELVTQFQSLFFSALLREARIVIAPDVHLGSDLSQVLHQVVDEGVVVVDYQDPYGRHAVHSPA